MGFDAVVPVVEQLFLAGDDEEHGYGIYNEAREQARKEAVAWFDEHLKR